MQNRGYAQLFLERDGVMGSDDFASQGDVGKIVPVSVEGGIRRV